MFNVLFLIEYSFINGFLIHYFFAKNKESTIPEIVLSSILLSICVNSLILYLLVRLIDLPITQPNIIIMSALLTFIIFFSGMLKRKL